MTQQGDDCYFYFYSTCAKVWLGFLCLHFRPCPHLEEKGVEQGETCR